MRESSMRWLPYLRTSALKQSVSRCLRLGLTPAASAATLFGHPRWHVAHAVCPEMGKPNSASQRPACARAASSGVHIATATATTVRVPVIPTGNVAGGSRVAGFPPIDAHVHLCDPGGDHAHMHGARTAFEFPTRLGRVRRGNLRRRAVSFVEVGAPPGQEFAEAHRVTASAEKDLRIAAMVGSVPPETGAAAAAEAALGASSPAAPLPSMLRLRPNRLRRDRGWNVQPRFRTGLRLSIG